MKTRGGNWDSKHLAEPLLIKRMPHQMTQLYTELVVDDQVLASIHEWPRTKRQRTNDGNEQATGWCFDENIGWKAAENHLFIHSIRSKSENDTRKEFNGSIETLDVRTCLKRREP